MRKLQGPRASASLRHSVTPPAALRWKVAPPNREHHFSATRRTRPTSGTPMSSTSLVPYVAPFPIAYAERVVEAEEDRHPEEALQGILNPHILPSSLSLSLFASIVRPHYSGKLRSSSWP